MWKNLERWVLVGATLWGVAVGTTSCTTVLAETAKKAREDRTTQDQVTDTKIAAGVGSRLAAKDKGLLLDVNVDVWEQRVMLTGTLDDPSRKEEVERLVRADERIRTVYDEIQIVSNAEQTQRREAAESKDASKKQGMGQAVNDFWIESKINAKLVAARGVTSVNYRWRSVRDVVYIIGRARSDEEVKTVLDIIRVTDGVSQVQPFIEVKS